MEKAVGGAESRIIAAAASPSWAGICGNEQSRCLASDIVVIRGPLGLPSPIRRTPAWVGRCLDNPSGAIECYRLRHIPRGILPYAAKYVVARF